MYLYKVADGKTVPVGLKNISLDKGSFFGFIGFEESEEVINAFGLNGKAITESFGNKTTTYENREGFDLLCVNILSRKSPLTQINRVCVYLGKSMKLFFCKDADAVLGMTYPQGNIAEIEYGRLLSVFF